MSASALSADFSGFGPVVPGLVLIGLEPQNGDVLAYSGLNFGPDGCHEVVVELGSSTRFGHLPPALRKIFSARGQRCYWQYAKEVRGSGHGDSLVARLTTAGDHPVVAMVEPKGDRRVVYIRTLLELVSGEEVVDTLVLYELKRQAATSLGVPFVTSENEATALRVEAERRREAEAAERAALHARHVAERQERVQAILLRVPLTVYTKEGAEKYGIPVVGREWESLPHGTAVMVVSSYDADSGTVGAPSEHFVVMKARGKNPVRGSVVAVCSARPEQSAVTVAKGGTVLPKPVGHQVVCFDNGMTTSVSLFANTDDAALHRQARAITIGWYAVFDGSGEKILCTADGRTVAKTYRFMETSRQLAA